MIKTKIWPLLLVALLLAACRDREQADVQAPVIEQIFLNGIATDTIQVTAGSSHELSVVVSDNVQLEQLKLQSVIDPNQPIPSVGNWTLFNDYSLTQADATVLHAFSIPDSASGFQLLTISLFDNSGYSIQKTIPLIITNANAPTIIGSTAPAFVNNVISLNAGDNLNVSGEAGDSDGLQSLKVMLWNSSNTTMSTTEINITGNPMAFVGASFDNANAGQFRVVIEAIDNLGYKSYWGKWVNVN